MAQTTAGALKVLIEGLGLGLTAYRDRAPQGTNRPYASIVEEVALTPDQLEDAAPSTAVETVQVDLWQDFRDLAPGSPTYGNLKESYTLAPALRRGIHGQRLQSIAGGVVYMALVRSGFRFLEEDANIVHHALTIDVHRQL